MTDTLCDNEKNAAQRVAQNLAAIQQEIDEACREAACAVSPDSRDVQGGAQITAVSKMHDSMRIRPALEFGHRNFGENRVQEAMTKWPSLKEEFSDLTIRLIGPLQSNKARDAVSFFDVIETVDRPKLARTIADEISRQGRAPQLFIQINSGEEDQKSGIMPSKVDEFIRLCRDEYKLSIDGLMCIPPVLDVAAPHFSLLKKIAERNGLQGLSMGMSNDYLTAARLGATHVRIGTAIFGARPTHHE